MKGWKAMNIRGIILAAGLSTRMGKNKLQLNFKGRSIINIVIDSAKASALSEVVLVYGKYDVNTDVKKMYNPNYERGMSTSIIEGLKDFQGDGVMLLLGDMPLVNEGIINYLLEGFNKAEKGLVVPMHEGKRGNPVIVGKKYFQNLLGNKGDKGARDIINNNLNDVEWVQVQSKGIFIDVDEEDAYKLLEEQYGTN